MGPPPNSQAAPLPKDLPFRVVSKTIGQGAYAFIRKAAPLTASNPVIAVKFINKEHAYRTGRLKPNQIQHEVTLHKHLGRHHNVIQYLSHGEDRLYTWIAMELADGGDLFDKIEADEGVGEDVAHLYFTQLVNAVSYMHSKGVAHRDIKPENMLLSVNGDLKLSDFGLAALFQISGRKRLCNSVCGSPPYIAPEIVAGKKSKAIDVLDKGYEPNIADIWSCGIVLFVLLVGNTPWDEPTRASYEFNEYLQTKGRTTDELWKKIPPGATSLLRGMLKIDPQERFTLDEIRTHPWYTRSNPHLSQSGTAANPILLATQMLESLRIDFNADPTASQREHRQRYRDAMEAGNQPVRFAATQPETLIMDTSFEWEQPPRLAISENFSSSQPAPERRTMTTTTTAAAAAAATTNSSRAAASASALSHELLGRLAADDPSLSQFTPAPAVPLSLTQAARQFADIMPRHSLARFLSLLPLALLLPSLGEALHRVGVPVAPSTFSAGARRGDEPSYIRVKTVDGRQQLLCGTIVVERIDDADGDVSEVRFVKAKGDPLEWRRFFKKIVVLCKDAIYVPAA
ncbi:serine threonine-protein kinase chk1 [Diplodia corticola]|uniref:non-specific serine/threonine protein kinase n=1 Tax=Diplodia corticola TaxID=236234 RepID=A0A1J9RLX8_9PEZI|nr:serine threonine-protein kinase chk1 [Diplodia corticola]OJD33579.1 serine threonine-protein kinase chk1 [Diplodia corticola]